jgi:hypothetical protein
MGEQLKNLRNLMGTQKKKKKKKPLTSPPTPLKKKKNWTLQECMLSILIGCITFSLLLLLIRRGSLQVQFLF